VAEVKDGVEWWNDGAVESGSKRVREWWSDGIASQKRCMFTRSGKTRVPTTKNTKAIRS
jgi:hypothetical protein